ncbi:sugar phosphate isomerase/epimerase family protein [Paenibacillus oceani]|uniref:Sugar phosphate isomerase/epimerase n=1 Tax=Paenibacillus oceani TaxID=2772510 RepID=A0A927C6P4_9BACL|nr:TIM barrel protein [Paenibacillus oceani]MBD2860736.1 sugar phosphate isomerase/epimerase [Paenibacillus oceani]
MNNSEPWRQRLQLGINHHLLYPASFESVEVHKQTIACVLNKSEYEVIDMFVPEDGDTLDYIAKRVRESGKAVVYNMPLMNGVGYNPHSPDTSVREHTLDEAKSHVRRARRLGARKIVVASGIDPGVGKRDEQRGYFVEYLTALCSHAGPDLDILIEPFDRSIGKCLLIGPSEEAVEIVRRVHRNGTINLGLLVDMGHIPLMEETFRHALQTASPYVRHIHLGSCVKRIPNDPLYGDMHPPWGYPGGEHDVPELVDFLQELVFAGYLGEDSRPTVTFEMRPYLGLTEEESMSIFLAKFREAWGRIRL